MHKHPAITETRIDQFVRLTLQPRILGEAAPLQLSCVATPCASDREAAAAERAPAAAGYRWGPLFGGRWFLAEGRIPRAWAGRHVVAVLEVGGERTIWRDGRPVWGLDEAHHHYRVARVARGGARVAIWVEAFGGYLAMKVGRAMPQVPADPFVVGEVSLRTFDEALWHLWLDCRVAHGLLQALPADDVARAHLLRALNDVVNRYDPADPSTVAPCRELLAEQLARRRDDAYHQLTPLGHAHLDTAWLWPLETSVKKMAHTAANQLALLAEYPEHRFVHSQPAQYVWLEERYPALFEAVRERVAAGQWEPVGAMWVEADANVPSGESLVRQVLYGKRYFASRFGVDVRSLWLPDVFGYSAALPQIMARAGIDAFLTQKISWNQLNRFPHSTFWWQGIDGTRVWTHFPPADTYGGTGEPAELLRHLGAWNKDHARCDEALYLYGLGDGGGGPAAENLELLRRAEQAPALPRIARRSAARFFEEARAASRDLETWVGELYLELHRGTYTTQARNKAANRRCEHLLRDAELLACFDPEFPTSYPGAELEALWKRLLVTQFHDILPGSSVREVYEDTARDFAAIEGSSGQIIAERLQRIGAALAGGAPRRRGRSGQALALYRGASAPAEGRLPAPRGKPPRSLRCGDEQLPVQRITDLDGTQQLLFAAPRAASMAVARAELSRAAPKRAARTHQRARGRRLESDDWIVRFDAQGNLCSVVDRAGGEEWLAEGRPGNLLQLFDDVPNAWDAWDVDVFALETGRALLDCTRFEDSEGGPVRVAFDVERRFGDSRVVQRISLGPTPGIRFDTLIDWHERNKLLKVAFPVRVNAARATHEIQLGSVERPTHYNTSWDLARFEVCSHRWVDLSEGARGVALLNDSKYGCDVQGDTLRLTLLRAPKAPDPEADMGRHRFSYVLLPHRGTHREGGVAAAALALNAPLRWQALSGAAAGGPAATPRLIDPGSPDLAVAAVKRAEDDEALIVRLYEAHNTRGRTRLRCARPVRCAELCDLLERPERELPIADGAVLLDFAPFEILTLRLSLA